MATSKEYLNYVLEQLSPLSDVSYRPMMGEYVVYYRGKVIGGLYDGRFLIKPTPSVLKMLPGAPEEIPYEGAKKMIMPDLDDRESLCAVIEAMEKELPEPKPKIKKIK